MEDSKLKDLNAQIANAFRGSEVPCSEVPARYV